ncbi:MAG: 16S rRNA (adenine(1518)-N(6)/adenine(1519)-N(6))-dimethyltransferase RsmA [Nibricoccus sp.]
MPLTPTATRELLTKLSHQPKRFLGQNFLVDGNIVRKSLELAEIKAGDTVVEVGPGLGTLTSALLAAGAEVWAVEKDRRLHEHLATTLAVEYRDQFHLLEGDGVEDPLARLPAEGREFKVVANLPYAISTPWMDAVLSGPLPARMVLMLQQEAAQRYTATVCTKQFSAISIFLQAAYEVAPGHKVPAACFYPRPDIESYLLHLVRKPSPFIFSPATREVIRGCFQQRRKQIGSLLRDKLSDHGRSWVETLAEFKLGPQARPEEIPVAAWTKLKTD